MKSIHPLLLILSILIPFTTIAQGSITVNLKTELGEAITNASVILTQSIGEPYEISIPENNDSYTIANLRPGTYTVSIEKDINQFHGVSTFDLVLLHKHVLGIDLLDSSYKLIAADYNGDGNITVFDIILTNNLILYIQEEYLNVPSWKFIDMNLDLSDIDNIGEISNPVEKTITITGSEEIKIDLIGVKMGDLNNSAKGNN